MPMHPQTLPDPRPRRSRLTRLGSEDGAIAPLMGAAVIGLVVASLLGANALSLYAARRELQRAADLGALAGAANLPLIGLLSSGEPQATGCSYADELLTAARAPLANNLSTTQVGPTCGSGGVTVEPLVESELIDLVQAGLDEVVDGVYDELGTLDLCSPLARLLDPLLATLLGVDCARLQTALNGLPQNLSPATVTPRVRVTVADTVEAPVPLPDFFDRQETLRSIAVARRRFKNLIVLPATCRSLLSQVPAACSDLTSGAPAPLDSIDLGNLNATAASACGLLVKVQEVNDTLNTELADVGAPNLDLSQLILDARDLCDPPAGATPPSPIDLAVEAAETGDPIVLLRLFEMPVLGIPALDFTAAYLDQVSGDTFSATPIPLADLTTARGLFGATLVQQ